MKRYAPINNKMLPITNGRKDFTYIRDIDHKKRVDILKNGIKTLSNKHAKTIWYLEREKDELNSDINYFQRTIDNLELQIEKDQSEYQTETEDLYKTIEYIGEWEDCFYNLFNSVYGNLKGVEKQKKLNEFITGQVEV